MSIKDLVILVWILDLLPFTIIMYWLFHTDCNTDDMFESSPVFASCFGGLFGLVTVPRWRVKPTRPSFLILFLSHHRVWSAGRRRSASVPVTHSAELRKAALRLSWRHRGSWIRLVLSEPWASEEITTREEKKGGRKGKKNEADLKNSRQMSVYVGCVRSRRNTGAGCASVDSRLGESGRITRRGLTQRRGGK